MIELIYLEEAEPQEPVKEAILQEFPGATFEDASDFVHANRLQVEIPGEGGEEAERAFFASPGRRGWQTTYGSPRTTSRANKPPQGRGIRCILQVE